MYIAVFKNNGKDYLRLMESYRALDRHGREMVLLVLEKEKERMQDSEAVRTPAESARVLPSIGLPREGTLPRKRVIKLYDMICRFLLVRELT